MALDSNALQTAIKAAFKKAKDTPPPSDPTKAGALQEQILTQLALDLATAMSSFVRGADVVQVAVQVTNAGVVIGTGAQTGVGKLQ